MTIKGKAYIGGIFEHPARKLGDDISQAELHAVCLKGALDDAGLSFKDVDGFYGGAHSRVYPRQIVAPGTAASSAIGWLLFGFPGQAPDPFKGARPTVLMKHES